MNVKQLIEALSTLDPELMVVRSGYEGGVTEVDYVSAVEVALNVNEEWYYGEHDVIHSPKEHPDAKRAKAVQLS